METVAKQSDEELYGTWVNEKALATVFYGQKSVVGPDAIDIYSQASDPAPGMVLSWEISSKWTDSEGNVWYKTFGARTAGAYPGLKFQALEKISGSGTVWERVVTVLETGRFNPAFFPRAIDPGAAYYRVLRRVQK
jgi:hypothetical protein